MSKSKNRTTEPAKEMGNTLPYTTTLSNKIYYLLLLIIPFLLYINTLQNGYVLDDIMVLKENTLVMKGLKGIPQLFATPHIYGYFNVANDLYRPLSLVMFAIEYQFFGANPLVGHLINILVYVGCVLVLYRFLILLFGSQNNSLAFLAALLFAIHPIHTEVVANIKSRDELLCFLLAFMALNQFCSYAKGSGIMQLLVGSIALFLACLAKETAITFLGIIPILFFFYFNENKKRSVLIIVGTVMASGLFLVIRTMVLQKYQTEVASNTPEFVVNALVNAPSVTEKLATEIFVLGKYLKLLLLPFPLICNYSFSSIPFVGFGDVGVLLTILIYGLLLYTGMYRLIKLKKDVYAFGILFYMITLALFSNLFFLIGSQMSERFLFFPSVGFCVIIAVVVRQVLGQQSKIANFDLKNKKVLLFIIPVSIVCSAMTINRNKDWKSNYDLFKADVEKSPNDSRLNYYYANSLRLSTADENYQGNTQAALTESMEHLNQALAIYPKFAEVHAEMGMIYYNMHRYAEAEKHYLEALKESQNNSIAAGFLASVYYTQKRYTEAITLYKKTLAISPYYKLAQLNLARCFMDNKQYDSATVWFNKILIGEPDLLMAQQCIAQSFYQMQQYDSAIIHFKRVIALKPTDLDEQNNLGVVYLNAKNYEKAQEQFQNILALNPNYVSAYSNMGMAYFYQQQYRQAINWFRQELEISPNDNSNFQSLITAYNALGKKDSAKIYEAK